MLHSKSGCVNAQQCSYFVVGMAVLLILMAFNLTTVSHISKATVRRSKVAVDHYQHARPKITIRH